MNGEYLMSENLRHRSKRLVSELAIAFLMALVVEILLLAGRETRDRVQTPGFQYYDVNVWITKIFTDKSMRVLQVFNGSNEPIDAIYVKRTFTKPVEFGQNHSNVQLLKVDTTVAGKDSLFGFSILCQQLAPGEEFAVRFEYDGDLGLVDKPGYFLAPTGTLIKKQGTTRIQGQPATRLTRLDRADPTVVDIVVYFGRFYDFFVIGFIAAIFLLRKKISALWKAIFGRGSPEIQNKE